MIPLFFIQTGRCFHDGRNQTQNTYLRRELENVSLVANITIEHCASIVELQCLKCWKIGQVSKIYKSMVTCTKMRILTRRLLVFQFKSVFLSPLWNLSLCQGESLLQRQHEATPLVGFSETGDNFVIGGVSSVPLLKSGVIKENRQGQNFCHEELACSQSINLAAQ